MLLLTAGSISLLIPTRSGIDVSHKRPLPIDPEFYETTRAQYSKRLRPL